MSWRAGNPFTRTSSTRATPNNPFNSSSITRRSPIGGRNAFGRKDDKLEDTTIR